MPNLKFKLLKSRLEWTLTYSCHFEEKKGNGSAKVCQAEAPSSTAISLKETGNFLATIYNIFARHRAWPKSDNNRTRVKRGGVGGNYRVRPPPTHTCHHHTTWIFKGTNRAAIDLRKKKFPTFCWSFKIIARALNEKEFFWLSINFAFPNISK